MLVLLAELSEIDGYRDALQWVTLEDFVHSEELGLGIPPCMVKGPALPRSEGVEDLLLAEKAYGSQLDGLLGIGVTTDPGEDVACARSKEGLVGSFPGNPLV
jgi:hypothetical protein